MMMSDLLFVYKIHCYVASQAILENLTHLRILTAEVSKLLTSYERCQPRSYSRGSIRLSKGPKDGPEAPELPNYHLGLRARRPDPGD